jgi:hypothetical protein
MTMLPNTTLREPAQRWRRGSRSRPRSHPLQLRSNLPSRGFAGTNRYDRRRRGRVARAGFASRVRDDLRVVQQQLRGPGADLLAPSCRFCADLAPARLCAPHGLRPPRSPAVAVCGAASIQWHSRDLFRASSPPVSINSGASCSFCCHFHCVVPNERRFRRRVAGARLPLAGGSMQRLLVGFCLAFSATACWFRG